MTDSPQDNPGSLSAHPVEPGPDRSEQPPSKNALKRALKAERLAAQKLERRAREKEAKKQKKRDRDQRRQAGLLDSDDDQDKKPRPKRRKVASSDRFGGRLVIDLGFDEKMSDKV
jgi:tRNA (guanine9-N1)-methyltransferase